MAKQFTRLCWNDVLGSRKQEEPEDEEGAMDFLAVILFVILPVIVMFFAAVTYLDKLDD